MGEQQTQSQSTWGSNQHYQDASIIKIRLETHELLSTIEQYLTGSRMVPVEVIVDKDGNVVEPQDMDEEKAANGDYSTRLDWQTITTGKARANNTGVQGIMSFVGSIVNPAVVQGNLTTEQWQTYVYETNLSLVKTLLVNQSDWEVSDENVEPICDHVMSLVQPFMSRTIEDGERGSYETKIHTVESNTVRGKGFGINKG